MFLLHYWSLGVEMQFYAIAPCILMICRHLRVHSTKFLLLIFAMSKIYEVHHKYYFGTFYLLQGRIWQFAVGMIAYIHHKEWNKSEGACIATKNYPSPDEIPLMRDNDQEQHARVS